jgi:hyperosmotically inducible protein
MKLPIILVTAFITLAAFGCKREDAMEPSSETQTAPAQQAAKGPDDAVPADNTDKNERDRNSATLTPGDQGESEADRTITQQARQSVVAEDDFSMAAKNVKIITVDGVVTLRGPVENVREKTEIAAVVNKVQGVKRVDNQLEIASK